ncbi:MAG: 4Fe-4S binding protein [Candidatus Bathyarchaeota archaeon]|nr:MAG: 4Fe-4S binding protein [Candidatus Bathyarchaeota archaeon]
MKNLKRAILRVRTLRIISLLIFFLLFNAVLFGFEPLSLPLPVLQSLGNSQTTIVDAFAATQHMLWEPVFPWLPLASFLIVAMLLGRMTCGWACPFGFFQEILGYIKKKHLRISPRTHRDLVNIKYLILTAVLLISVTVSAMITIGADQSYRNALGIFAQAPFNSLSPHDTLFAVVPSIIFNAFSSEAAIQEGFGEIAFSPLFWIRLSILVLILVFAVYTPRSWCRYFCPVGALLALLNHFSFLGLKRDVIHCTKESCRSCVQVCPMEVPILDLPWEKFSHPECIYCLECVDACTTRAIKPKLP